MRELISITLVSMFLVDCGGGDDNHGPSTGAVVEQGGTTGSTGGTQGTLHSGGANTAGSTTLRSGGTTGVAGATGTGGGARGTGGSPGTLSNVLDVVVDEGPPNVGYVNGLFAKVTICEPSTSNCQTIDHVIVDTGSFGLRVLESAVTLSLPAVKNSSGNPLAECAQFVSGTAWGPIVRADVKMAGETATSIPIQIIGENTYPMPSASACSGTSINDVSTLGSNGILGVGIYQQDCGTACTLTNSNPGIYMACTSTVSGGCKSTVVPLNSQVTQPIVGFPVDNNGLIIQLPSVPDQGSSLVSGKLVFGIGTQTNNGLGSAKVFTPVDAYGNIGTTFPLGGTQYAGFLDSGSNAIYFLNSAKSGLTGCSSKLSSFYCPPSTTSLDASIFGNNGSSADIHFNVANATQLNGSMCAFNDLAGPMPGFPASDPGSVDYLWGLAFFFGRSIYTAIEQQDTPSGQGPYVAF
jgi:hypothetical protein